MGSEKDRKRLYDALLHRRESDATSLAVLSRFDYWLDDRNFYGKFVPVSSPGADPVERMRLRHPIMRQMDKNLLMYNIVHENNKNRKNEVDLTVHVTVPRRSFVENGTYHVTVYRDIGNGDQFQETCGMEFSLDGDAGKPNNKELCSVNKYFKLITYSQAN
jgi:hypothetical protein